jgi:hypothetical protein
MIGGSLVMVEITGGLLLAWAIGVLCVASRLLRKKDGN